MRNTQIESLVSRIKTKDPILYEILRSLNLDSRDTHQSVAVVETTQEQVAIDLTVIEAEIAALQAAILLFATQVDLDALSTLFGNHKDRHVSGGLDAFVTTDLIDALVKRVRTVTADLVFGTVNDGEFLKRSGSTIISAAAGSLGRWEPVTNGDPAFPEVMFNASGDILMNFIP